MRPKLRKESGHCTLCHGSVVLDGNCFLCLDCGHRMSRADFPKSDRALHGAAEQAAAFAEEGQRR